MKILLDSCVWGKARAELEAAGHDVACAADWPADPGGEEILARAYQQSRILVTLDKDFGELAVLRGLPHHGVIRLVGVSAHQQATVCLQVLNRHGDELQKGALVTAEPGRLRIRLPEK
jgi:predicted nuclease of predicted toxin-antitoxin system